MEGLNGVL